MRTIKLRPLGGKTVTGTVKNPQATIGAAASITASQSGLGGQFRIFEGHKPCREVSPDARIEDLPRDTEFLLVPDLTPAGLV